MKHIFFVLFGLLLISFSLPSCNTARRLEKGKLRKKSSNFLVKKLEQNRVAADWFSGKARVTFDGSGYHFKASTNIRIRKDSVVWLNVKKIGIEVARVQITPDSVYFLNRLTREYGTWDVGALEGRFGLPLGFSDLQELLLGNAVIVEKEALEAGVVQLRHKLGGQQAGVDTEYFLDGLTYLLEQINVADPNREWRVQIDQEEHGAEKEYPNFPYFRNFAIDSEQTGPIGLNVKFSKIEINVPKNIHFEIPSRYSRIE